MAHDLICSYFTVSGVVPGDRVPSKIPFADRVRACAEAGYAGIGVYNDDYAALRSAGQTDAELRSIVRDNGIRHVEVEFLINWFVDDERAVASRAEEEILYQAAEAFDARVMFLSGDMSPNSTRSADMMAEKFAQVCARANERGVTVGVEPVAFSNIPDPLAALALIDASGARNAGIFLDIWHLFRGNLDYQSFRSLPPERIVGIQLNDAHTEAVGTLFDDTRFSRLLPGQGDARTAEFVQVMIETGVTCPFSVEVISNEQRARTLEEAAKISYQTTSAIVAAAQEKVEAAREISQRDM